MGLFRRSKPSAVQLVPVSPYEEELREYAADATWAGLRDRATTVEHVLAYFEDDDPEPSREEAEAAVARAWEARTAELAAATGPDASEAVFRAFADLERRGLVTRTDFGAMQPDGHDLLRAEPATARGYVFFSELDTDTLSTGSLDIAFGPYGEAAEAGTRAQRKAHEAAVAALAAEVTEALRAQGLTVTPHRLFPHIVVVDVTGWRRPLPA